jgi:hypothetical protein
MKQKTKRSRLHWHPAFFEAIQMDLAEYRDSLEFLPEYQLSSEPQRIDCVIIKKVKDVEIKHGIAAIFRDVNIVEYKSPGDYVSTADFYKVYGYACQYVSIEKVPITSLTVSFVASRYPRELFTHLRKVRGYAIEETASGIYTVRGDILPLQLIDNRRLSSDENLWLRSLSDRLDVAEIARIGEEAARQDKEARIQAFLEIMVKANYLLLEEAAKMSDMPKSLRDVLIKTGWVAKWRESEALEIAQNMVNEGYPFETVVSLTKLDPEKAKALYQNPAG